MISTSKLIKDQIQLILSSTLRGYVIDEFKYDKKLGKFGSILLDRKKFLFSMSMHDNLNYEVKDKDIIIKYEDLILTYLENQEIKRAINFKLDDNFHINKKILTDGRIISILLRNNVFCKKEHIDLLYTQNTWFVDVVQKIVSEELLQKILVLHPESFLNFSANYLANKKFIDLFVSSFDFKSNSQYNFTLLENAYCKDKKIIISILEHSPNLYWSISNNIKYDQEILLDIFTNHSYKNIRKFIVEYFERNVLSCEILGNGQLLDDSLINLLIKNIKKEKLSDVFINNKPYLSRPETIKILLNLNTTILNLLNSEEVIEFLKFDKETLLGFFNNYSYKNIKESIMKYFEDNTLSCEILEKNGLLDDSITDLLIKNVQKEKAKDIFLNNKKYLSNPKLIKALLKLDVSILDLYSFDEIIELSKTEIEILGKLIENKNELSFSNEVLIDFLKQNKENTKFIKNLLNSTYLIESDIARLLNKQKLVNNEIESDLNYLNDMVFKQGREKIIEFFTDIKPGTITEKNSFEISRSNKYNALEYFDKKLFNKDDYKNLILLNKAYVFQDEISQYQDLLDLFFKTHWQKNKEHIERCYKKLINVFCPPDLETIEEKSSYISSLLLHEELNTNLSKNGFIKKKLKI